MTAIYERDRKRLQCATMLISVDRPFANSEGVYEQDEIAVTLWKGIAQTTCDVCAVNDVVAVKGRMATHLNRRDNVTYRNYEVIARKSDFRKESRSFLIDLYR